MRSRAYSLLLAVSLLACTPVDKPASLAVTCAPDDLDCMAASDGSGGAAGTSLNGSGGTDSMTSAANGGNGMSSANGASAGTGAANASSSGTQSAMSGAAYCGNGLIEMGETCDPATTCPTADTCQSSNLCLAPMLLGDPSTCNSVCDFVPIATCTAGDGCCGMGCDSTLDADCSATCGNGTVDALETCEATSADMPCAASCDDQMPCTKDLQTGTPEQCNVVCTSVPITQPANDDQCCPPGADESNDNDCGAPAGPTCGNLMLDPGEICDGDCPESCDDNDACSADEMTGSSTACTAACTNTPITAAAPGDGCCPPDANSTSDSDCSASCGNGVKEGNETCDGADCPTSCDDMDPCTMDVPVGNAAQCTADCSHKPITNPAGGDGCCPPRANANNDSDCKPMCGNRVKEEGEACDGADCSMNCNDGDSCTSDFTTGSPSSCDVACDHDDITPCCGNGRTESGETCDGSNCRMTCRAPDSCTDSRPVGNASDCNVRCEETEIRPCCGNGRTEAPETCDGDCSTRIRCDDGNPCTDDDVYVGSAADCDLDCGTPTVIGTGAQNVCNGCEPLSYTVGQVCTPTTSSRDECQIAGEWVCDGPDDMKCRNKVEGHTDCESQMGWDDDCDGNVDEDCPTTTP